MSTTINGWHPASDKPPSQTAVIAYVPDFYGHGYHRRVRALWLEPMTLLADMDCIDAAECESNDSGDLYVPGGWYEGPVYCAYQEQITDTVTHWIELPAPPICET